MKNAPLSPCPFCGGTARMRKLVDPEPEVGPWGESSYGVICTECGARGPTEDDRKAAALKWDRRKVSNVQ